MPFPETQRVIYKKHPIATVICQLQFHPILRINATEPVEFQDHVRELFPVYNEKTTEEVVLPTKMPPEIADQVRVTLKTGRTKKEYFFSSEDENWTVSLTRDFLALQSKKYDGWTDFRKKLENPLDALLSIYKPRTFTRIGLRYIDVIYRSRLNLPLDTPWSDLLQPHIAGVLGSAISPNVTGTSSHFQAFINNEIGSVQVKHGTTVDSASGENCYYIDCDFFNKQRKEAKDAIGILNQLNRRAGHLFRWCIKEKLHLAMEPTNSR